MKTWNFQTLRELHNNIGRVSIEQATTEGVNVIMVMYRCWDKRGRLHKGMKICKSDERARRVFEDKCAQYKIF